MKVEMKITMSNSESFPYVFKNLKRWGTVNVAIKGMWQDSNNETVFFSSYREIESMGKNHLTVKVDGQLVSIPFRYHNLSSQCEIKLTVDQEWGVI